MTNSLLESLTTLRKTNNSLRLDSIMSPKETVPRSTGNANASKKWGGFIEKCGRWDLNPRTPTG